MRDFFETGSKAGIQSHLADKLKIQLGLLDSALSWEDVNLLSLRLHELNGNLKEYQSMTVNGNRRLTFKFSNEDVELVDYQDYHSIKNNE